MPHGQPSAFTPYPSQHHRPAQQTRRRHPFSETKTPTRTPRGWGGRGRGDGVWGITGRAGQAPRPPPPNILWVLPVPGCSLPPNQVCPSPGRPAHPSPPASPGPHSAAPGVSQQLHTRGCLSQRRLRVPSELFNNQRGCEPQVLKPMQLTSDRAFLDSNFIHYLRSGQ